MTCFKPAAGFEAVLTGFGMGWSFFVATYVSAQLTSKQIRHIANQLQNMSDIIKAHSVPFVLHGFDVPGIALCFFHAYMYV